MLLFLNAALRAAETLKARTSRSSLSNATVIPYERGGSNTSNCSGDLASEDSEAEFCNQDLLRRGCEFLKRTRKGKFFFIIKVGIFSVSEDVLNE